MKIAIICDPLDLDKKTGIPVYCEKMVLEFMKDKEHSYVFFHMKENPLFRGFDEVIFPGGNSFGLWNAFLSVWRKFFLMPRECRKRNIDVVHDLNMIGIHTFDFFRKYKAVVTIFDLTPLIFKKYHGWLNVLGFNLFVKRSAKNADRVIAISEATKKDIIRFFDIQPNKVSVTLLGSDILERKPSDGPNFDSPFFLSVGTLEPRKNLKNLLKAFIKAKEFGIGPDIKLVLVGKIGWKIDSFLDELSLNSKYSDQIIMTGYLSDSQLAHLYGTCVAFVYPSFYEGFGLPVLEAMSMGAPVITSSTSSLPEVAGEACILCEPDDVGSITNAMCSVVQDVDMRKRLSQSGIERSKLFSWKRCADETISAYEEL